MLSRMLPPPSGKLSNEDIDAPSPPVTREWLPCHQGDCPLEAAKPREVPHPCPASPRQDNCQGTCVVPGKGKQQRRQILQLLAGPPDSASSRPTHPCSRLLSTQSQLCPTPSGPKVFNGSQVPSEFKSILIHLEHEALIWPSSILHLLSQVLCRLFTKQFMFPPV